MQTTHQKGFSLVALLIAVAAIAIVGLVAWRIWDSTRTSNDSQAQHAQDAPHGNNSTQDPAHTADPNEGYVVIKEWDVRFKPVEGLEGLEYYHVSNNDLEMITFTTEELAAAHEGCQSHPERLLLGSLLRSQREDGVGKRMGPIEGYYYYSQGPQAACSDEPNELEGPTLMRVLRSLNSLEAVE